MTPYGVAPDLSCPREGRGLAPASASWSSTTASPVDSLWRACLALHDAREELLRAHASTVHAMGRLSQDHARLREAMAEARRQHEALLFVRRALDALTTPTLTPSATTQPLKFSDKSSDSRGRTWLDDGKLEREGLTHGGRTAG